jgi:hypothetical protein
MTESEQVIYLKKEVAFQKKLIKILSKHYEATQDALSLQARGHSNGWAKVQKIAEKIEDDFNLDEYQ